MTYFLKAWTNDVGQTRLYINGTTRQSLYFKRADDGRVVWSSKSNDTPPKFRKGDHWGKIRKDEDAAREVAEAAGVQIGEGSGGAEWAVLLRFAETGLGFSGDDE